MSDNGKSKRGVSVKLGNTTYICRPITNARDMALLRERVCKRRLTPIEIAMSRSEQLGMSEKDKHALLAAALQQEAKFKDHVTDLDIAQFADTREGFAFTLWLMIRENHPDVKEEDIQDIIERASEEEFQKLMEERDNVTEEVTGEDSPDVVELDE